VDARYEHVRQDGRIVSQGVLIVAGVRAVGHREILAVEVADTESEATYHQLFRDLKARGLSGVRLVTSDSHQGLKAAIDRHFQGASWQRCQVHFSRDLIKMVGVGRRSEMAGDLREIFAVTTREQAMTTAEAVGSRWEASHPAVARLIEEGVEDCLACLAFPLAHRARIRTTNGLERLHEEIKRRTRVVRIFPNPEACLRLVTAFCVEQSEEWIGGGATSTSETCFRASQRREYSWTRQEVRHPNCICLCRSRSVPCRSFSSRVSASGSVAACIERKPLMEERTSLCAFSSSVPGSVA